MITEQEMQSPAASPMLATPGEFLSAFSSQRMNLDKLIQRFLKNGWAIHSINYADEKSPSDVTYVTFVAGVGTRAMPFLFHNIPGCEIIRSF